MENEENNLFERRRSYSNNDIVFTCHQPKPLNIKEYMGAINGTLVWVTEWTLPSGKIMKTISPLFSSNHKQEEVKHPNDNPLIILDDFRILRFPENNKKKNNNKMPEVKITISSLGLYSLLSNISDSDVDVFKVAKGVICFMLVGEHDETLVGLDEMGLSCETNVEQDHIFNYNPVKWYRVKEFLEQLSDQPIIMEFCGDEIKINSVTIIF